MLRNVRHAVSDAPPAMKVPADKAETMKVSAVKVWLLLFCLLGGLILTSSRYQITTAQSAEEGLVLWLKLDEGEGIFTTDSAPGGNLGTLRGGEWVPGESGSAVRLINRSENNLDPDWIQVGAAENQNLESQVTLAAWIKPDDFTDGAGIITKGSNITSYAMRLTDSGQLRFTANFGEPFGWQGAGDWDSFTTIGTNEWHHVAISYDGANVRFFLDGVADNNKPEADLVFGRATQPIFVGADLPDDDQFLNGAVDDVRVYNRALSTGEIQNLAERSNQPPTLTLPSAQSNIEGDSVSLPIEASDPEGQGLLFNFSGLPSNLQFDSFTGLISGDLSTGSAGNYTVDVSVTDAQNSTTSGSFSWIVTAPPPTETPTNVPTDVPTNTPTIAPTNTPTDVPTNTPTDVPTATPTDVPTATPTDVPTNTPTDVPANTPTNVPTGMPTDVPTDVPTSAPTGVPSGSPTNTPVATPTNIPTSEPIQTPLPTPTETATSQPADTPQPIATATPPPPNGDQSMGEAAHLFRHFEDANLDGQIDSGDRLLFQTTITNTGTISLTNVMVTQEDNPELLLVPGSIWIVRNQADSGSQLTNTRLPVKIDMIPAGSSASVLYIMEVQLDGAAQSDNIQSLAFARLANQEVIYARPLSITVLRAPSGQSGNGDLRLFLPLIE